MASVDFDLRQLEIFIKVVQLESFSKAADLVLLTQASVSERIATLEKLVGVKLLDRLGRKVVPTKAGELLYKHALQLLEAKRAACQEMEGFLGLKQGEVHIGGSTIPGEYILPEMIRDFHKVYPYISVYLSVGDSEQTKSKVLAGDLELGIVGSMSSHGSIEHHALWEDRLVLAVPADHPFSQRPQVNIEELVGEPFILREPGSGTLNVFESYLRASSVKGIENLNIVARLGSSTSVKEAVKAGLGVTVLSLKALDTELKTGILKAVHIEDLPMERKFYLIRDKRRSISPLCRAMLDFLLDTKDVGDEDNL